MELQQARDGGSTFEALCTVEATFDFKFDQILPSRALIVQYLPESVVLPGYPVHVIRFMPSS